MNSAGIYRNGEISQLICSCFCSYNCKHEFAVMLQLRETLELIEKNYGDEYERLAHFFIDIYTDNAHIVLIWSEKSLTQRHRSRNVAVPFLCTEVL